MEPCHRKQRRHSSTEQFRCCRRCRRRRRRLESNKPGAMDLQTNTQTKRTRQNTRSRHSVLKFSQSTRCRRVAAQRRHVRVNVSAENLFADTNTNIHTELNAEHRKTHSTHRYTRKRHFYASAYIEYTRHSVCNGPSPSSNDRDDDDDDNDNMRAKHSKRRPLCQTVFIQTAAARR